jgi:DNA-directed RNA polymerase subunit RPC12/RpoP
MALKILCAGGTKEEKEAAESAVRAGIGSRPPAESWTVSLVKVGRQWSVTMDGPDKSSPRATFIAGEGRLRDAIAQSMAHRNVSGGAGAHAGAHPGAHGGAHTAVPTGGATATSRTAAQRRNAYKCPKCGNNFVVSYDVEDGEGEEVVPAACPHCWSIENVKVGVTAAVNSDYRVEKS